MADPVERKDAPRELRPWHEAAATPLEQRAAALLAALPRARPLSPDSLQRLRAAVAWSTAGGRTPRWTIAAALAAGLCIGVMGARAISPHAGDGPIRDGHDPAAAQAATGFEAGLRPGSDADQPDGRRRGSLLAHGFPSQVAAFAEANTAAWALQEFWLAPEVETDPTAVGSEAPGHDGARAVAAARGPVAASRAQATSARTRATSESDLLREALHSLRQRRDPGAALALLDRYDADFPSGSLRREAWRARVDALLALGRHGAALELLDRIALGGASSDGSTGVLRGELRANAGRCRDALADFDVPADAPPALVERALYGRAGCLIRIGDERAARRELERYLSLFPSGRFAAEARRVLEASERR